MRANCYTCIHYNKNITHYPCNECFTNTERPNWESNKMETKQPDYSFNQSIIDALRDGKHVWYYSNSRDKWCEFDNDNIDNILELSTIMNGQWSLNKPKTMVKKQIKRWANIFNDDSFSHYSSKEDAARMGNSKHIKIAVPFVIEYEVEQE